MKISSVSSLRFGRALTTNQKQGYRDITQRAKQALGADGISLLKIDSSALPSDENKDTGVGKLNSPQGEKFLDMMQTYAGVNAFKDFPSGEMTKQKGGYYYGAYNRSAMTLGDDKINPYLLTQKRYGNLLKTHEIKRFVQPSDAPKHLINYRNVFGVSDMDEPPMSKGSLPDYFYDPKNWRAEDKQRIIRDFKADDTRKKGPYYLAWERFKELDENHPLKREYNEFYNKKHHAIDYEDIVTRRALAPYLKVGEIAFVTDGDDRFRGKNIWSDGYRFFEQFDTNPDWLTAEEKSQQKLKKQKYQMMKREYKDEIDYFKFKQFIAHKQLAESKEKINAQGSKFFVDALTGFSHWEQMTYPDAFLKGAGGRMGLPVLNVYEIQDPESPASKLLETKVKYYLENYDGIRFDVGWAYINSVYQVDGQDKFKWLGDTITNRIAKWAREVKGSDYDVRNLIYEFDNAGEMKPFRYENWGKPQETPVGPIYEFENLPGMAVLTTEYEHNDVDLNAKGWMNSYFLQNEVHVNPDKYILGTNNHDGTPLAILASSNTTKYKDLRNQNIGALMRVFNNYNVENFDSPNKFTKAKFAELYTTKNQFLFFMDLFGRKERVDSHCDKDGWGENNGGSEDYRKRLGADFEQEYHRAIQRGEGFNLAEVLARAMEAKDNNSDGRFLANAENKAIYNELRAYANYLYDNRGDISTEKQANDVFGNVSDIPDEYRTDYTQYRFYQ